jgi:hypothetical protein
MRLLSPGPTPEYSVACISDMRLLQGMNSAQDNIYTTNGLRDLEIFIVVNAKLWEILKKSMLKRYISSLLMRNFEEIYVEAIY